MLYLAAPMGMYWSREYRLALAEAQATGADVFDVRQAYASNRDWLERWPVERDRYTSIWVVTGPTGWIGKACATELVDLSAAGRPWYWWDQATDRFELGPSTGNYRRWCRLLRL